MTITLQKLLLKFPKTSVLDDSFKTSDFIKLDLSVNNQSLKTLDVSSAEDLGDYINQLKKEKGAKVAYGGYLEKRNIYKRSSHFNKEKITSERNIHLGLDLWLDAGAQIFAPLGGTIHSFQNNTNFGDYGPTIILEHKYEKIKWYTLYGHLSLESISNLKIGQQITKGELIATLGTPDINGNYAPHLHFQIIKDLENYIGDYPGVCSEDSLDHYAENCIDPNILLRF